MSKKEGETAMAEETVDTGNTADVGDVGTTNTETVNENINDNGTTTETNTEVNEGEQSAEQEVTTQALDYNAIKLPDGVSVSDEDRAKFIETVDKFGFKDQDSLQAFVDWMFAEAENNKALLAQQQADADKKWEDIKSSWKTSLESDADFGKDYDMNIKRANDVISKFGGSELATWLKESDLAGQPALLKTFARIGKEIEDARLIKGQSGIETNKVRRDRYNQPMLVYKED